MLFVLFNSFKKWLANQKCKLIKNLIFGTILTCVSAVNLLESVPKCGNDDTKVLMYHVGTTQVAFLKIVITEENVLLIQIGDAVIGRRKGTLGIFEIKEPQRVVK